MMKKLIQKLRLYKQLLYTSFSWITIKIMLKIPSKHFRRLYLNCHKNVDISKSVALYSGLFWWKGMLKVGAGTSVGFNCQLDCRKGISIGEDVCIASDVMIWTLHHDYNDINFKTKGGKVTIGNKAWICSRVIILPGVEIGEGAVVASGAVVCKNVEPWSVVGGVPAKVIGKREQKKYDYSPSSFWVPFV